MRPHVPVAFLFTSALAYAGSLCAQITSRTDEAGKLLNEWAARNDAAGLSAITYENRDGGHSLFDHHAYPQLRLYEATADEKSRKLDMAGANLIRQAPTFGNASMASPANVGGSLPRLYLLEQNGLGFLFTQYAHNNLFFYPEHQDYDDGWNGRGGWGDMYPANTPYLTISQGSSGTDQPFIKAFVSTSAAFWPDVQRALVKNNLLMPTLQSIFRSSNKQVLNEEDYFTGKAHPPVFQGTQIDEVKMVRAAHAMTVASIPPLVVMELVREGIAHGGTHFFEAGDGINERLGDTPCAIARVFRGSPWAREMVVSVGKSMDAGHRPLTFRWALLQGDPDRVKIEPQENGAAAKITVAWHPSMRRAEGIDTHRVDIGVFAGNGTNWSAPAFITFYMLPNEARFYSKEGRLEEICYDDGNPDLGLPSPRDLRWLTLGRRMGTAGEKSLGIKLLRQALPKEAAEMLRGIADELSPRQEAWRTLSSDAKKKTEADAARSELEALLEKRLSQSLQDKVRAAVGKIAATVELYVAQQEGMRAEAKASSKANALADLDAARQRLLDYLILKEVKPSQVAFRTRPDQLSEAERHYLQQFHLTVLNTALLPEFLDRVEAPSFVDPRLTTRKSWRDLHRYDKTGKWIGWTRITKGREYEFTAEGQLLPDGRSGKSVPVKYVKDAGGKYLLFVPDKP